MHKVLLWSQSYVWSVGITHSYLVIINVFKSEIMRDIGYNLLSTLRWLYCITFMFYSYCEYSYVAEQLFQLDNHSRF